MKKENKKQKNNKESLSNRLIYFIMGMGILTALTVVSIQWDLLPFKIMILGKDITPYALTPMLIFVGILGSSLLSSSFSGNRKIDI